MHPFKVFLHYLLALSAAISIVVLMSAFFFYMAVQGGLVFE